MHREKINPKDYGNLEAAIKRIENTGSPFIYVDISDGAYVNNFTSGLSDLRYVARTPILPIYLGLKIKNPLENIDLFLNVVDKVLVESVNRKTLISKLEELHEIGKSCHFTTIFEMNEHEDCSIVADEIIVTNDSFTFKSSKQN